MSTTRRFVLSTVGISTLLRAADRELGGRLIAAANDTALEGLLKAEVDALRETVIAELSAGDLDRNRELSAELKGIYALYEDQLARASADMHVLVATDTALGRLAAEIIQAYLRGQQVSTSVYAPPELSTADSGAFSRGIKELIEWCEYNVPPYQQDGYQVVFNLTGGFKSLQGYLNIVGMFYADRLVYIFQGSDQLLQIPRLPIRVAYEDLREHRVPLALMAAGHIIPRSSIPTIPGGLLEIDDGLATLSDWGLLIWNRTRGELLGEELLSLPSLRYTDRFRRAFARAGVDQRVQLQETLAEISGLLQDSDGDPQPLHAHGGLQFDNYTHRRTPDGRPLGHFRLSRGRRVSCAFEEDGTLLLRTFGEHDVVNDNP